MPVTQYKSRFAISLSLFVLLGLSCNLFQIISPSSDSSETQSPNPTNFIFPTDVPSPVPSIACPIQAQSPPPTFDAESFDITSALTEYLNKGGSLDELEIKIEELALLIQETPSVIEGDFNGDGFYDLVVSVLLPSEDVYPISGQSLVFLCQGASYELIYSTPQTTQIGVPRFYTVEDLTNDGLLDIILGIENCGAHTCFTHIEALTWTGETFENRLQGSSDDLPTPLIEINKNPTEIVVTGEGVASVGAGPNRGVERHWVWDDSLQSFIPSEDILLPSSYRIHAIHDSDQALEMGEIMAAIEGYNNVRDNDQLLDWVDPERERAILSAYAGFKLIVAHLMDDDQIAAETSLEELRVQFPEGKIGAAFTSMAEVFWAEFLLTNDVEASCMSASNYAEEHPADITEILYFGYANPSYAAEDLCQVIDSLSP